MSQGTYGYRKTVKKSEHWHRHGKHRPILGWLVQQRREREQQRYKEPLFASVAEAFAYWKGRY